MNAVQHIPQELFRGNRKLTVIHMSGNSLEDLPEEIFQGLVHLEELDLSNNVLTYIRPGVFKGTDCKKCTHVQENLQTIAITVIRICKIKVCVMYIYNVQKHYILSQFIQQHLG
jgi:Leucine-rich repeat (LRR) protein